MKLQLVSAAVASIALGFAIPSFAQSTFTHGESKRCESLSGEAKTQCDREEATKTQGPAAQESQPAAAGGSATFTHGESKRCESMSGADKQQCDRDEATKSQGQPASNPSNDSPQPIGAGAPPAGMSPD